MNQEEIIKRLKEGNKFTGRNGAFTGIVTPLIYADKANMLVVECEKDGLVIIFEKRMQWNGNMKLTIFKMNNKKNYETRIKRNQSV
jgi:hypothetical protein|nr:MAG TPA: hypothetical protein [Caudoviricetes sp.]